jgi:hypothetical protein
MLSSVEPGEPGEDGAWGSEVNGGFWLLGGLGTLRMD